MSFTLARQHPAIEQRASALRLVAPSRRRPVLLAGSALLLAACTALFASAYVKAGHAVPVLAVTQAVPQGAALTTADLTVVRLAASGHLSPVAASDAARVVGRHAAVALMPGSLLTMAQLSDAPSIPVGESLVGVSLKASQLPAEGVTPGEYVDVVLTGTPGAPAFTSSGPAIGAQTGSPSTSATPSASSSSPASAAGAFSVFAGAVIAPHVLVTTDSPGTAANGDTTGVSLLVPANLAPMVATASAANQVALVAVAAPSTR